MNKVKKVVEAQPSGRRWKQWKESDARAALASLRGSGLGMGAFCKREGYSETRLRYWMERLEEPSRVQSRPVTFLPIAVSDIGRAKQIEIEHAGVVLRVREDMDVAHVARLVAALGAAEMPC